MAATALALEETREEFSLLHYSAGDALRFVFQNGARSATDASSLATPSASSPALPGLCKVVELQVRQGQRDRARKGGAADDPLYLEELTPVGTHEQWCAHSQTACMLAKNAVTQSLQERIDVRVRRYGEAVMRLAEVSGSSQPTSKAENEEASEATPTAAAEVAYATPTASVSSLSSLQSRLQAPASSVKEAEDGEELVQADDDVATVGEDADGGEDEDKPEELETFLLQHPSREVAKAAAWVRRRYLRCCEVIGVRPVAAVRQQLARAVQSTQNGTIGAILAAHKRISPLSPASETPTSLLVTPAGRSWMSFPETVVALREMCIVPLELDVNLSGCTSLGQRRRHFIAVLGVLEGCRNTVVSLNLAKTGLTDDEVRVLCLFCRAYLRRLKVLDLSGNKSISDKVAVWLKQLAASAPLLCRLTVRGTSLSRSQVRTITGILCRKAL